MFSRSQSIAPVHGLAAFAVLSILLALVGGTV
jgi:hypothetical protein